MDKALMINKIKEHFGIKNDAAFADLLGITPQALSNWKARNTYNAELIYTKCEGLSPSWLLTGEGGMLKKDSPPQPKDPSLKEVLDRLEERGNELALLKRDYDALRKENEYLKKELQAKRIHTPKHE